MTSFSPVDNNDQIACILHPRLIACVACGDDAELVGAPGPGEPVDEYTCISCGRSFLSDGSQMRDRRPAAAAKRARRAARNLRNDQRRCAGRSR